MEASGVWKVRKIRKFGGLGDPGVEETTLHVAKIKKLLETRRHRGILGIQKTRAIGKNRRFGKIREIGKNR